MSQKCSICLKPLEKPIQSASDDLLYYDCRKCGKFLQELDPLDQLTQKIDDLRQEGPNTSYKIRRAIKLFEQQGETFTLTGDTLDAIIRRPLPNPKEQADLLVRLIGERSHSPGRSAELTPDKDRWLVGALDNSGFKWLVEHLAEEKRLNAPDNLLAPSYKASLTYRGWDHFEDLKRGGHTYNQAFMAMKFEDAELDKVIADVFAPSCEKAGFYLIDLSKQLKAGLIDDRIRVEIQSSDFLIADLTHDSHGAYWEAGYAEGLGKPVIYTCKKDKFDTSKTHFDTNHHLTIVWDPENLQEAGEQLKATIRATLPGVAKMKDD